MAEDAGRKSQCVSSTRDALIIESVGGIGGDSDLMKGIGYQPDISIAFSHQSHFEIHCFCHQLYLLYHTKTTLTHHFCTFFTTIRYYNKLNTM